MKSHNDKFQIVIAKNTFYFFNPKFEEKYEGYLNSIKETLLVLKNEIENNGLKKTIFENLLMKENGLRALLALTGFSNEYLKRLTTIIRVVNDKELNELVYKKHWAKDKETTNVNEWSDSTIYRMIHSNEWFRKGIVNIFFEGATIPFLSSTIPLFELEKLSISKLKFEIPEMIDTLIRYKEKGSYAGMADKNAETMIKKILKELDIKYQSGDLAELVKNAPFRKRRMDFILPNKKSPKIIIESSFVATTSSSGQGDKAKNEIAVRKLIKKHYKNVKFIGFVDGIGWYVRKNDLLRMVSAFDDVFTFHKDELVRFQNFLIQEIGNKK